MYRLKHAARLAYNYLVKKLAPEEYYSIQNHSGIWKHISRPKIFTLCIDDFGIKYTSKKDANHLIKSIAKHFTVSVDDEGKHYLGLTLDWYYKNRWVDISMPGYTTAARKKFLHEDPKTPQHAPHDWNAPVYGKKIQLAEEQDNTRALPAKEVKKVQAISGTFLYYGRAVDPSILPALNEISMQQSAPTEKVKAKCK